MSEYVDALELLRWERRVANLVADALRQYLEGAREAVLPSLTAAGLEPIEPDPDALTSTYAHWEALLVAGVLPGLELLMAERVVRLTDVAGVVLPPVEPRPDRSTPPARPPALEGPGERPDVPADGPDAPTPTPSPDAPRETPRITPRVTPRPGIYAAASPDLEKAYAIPTVREWMETYLATVNNRMVRTPDSVFRLVASALDEGTASGEGVVDLRDRVQDVLDYTGNSDWPHRAELVARTEVTGAYNAAGLEAARLEEQTLGIVLEKAWVCTIDGATRNTHFAADGQRVGLDGTFAVGSASLRYPGDPEGPVEEIANCRCTMIRLEPDEPLPTESDRQTERGPTDSVVKRRDGRTRREEIDKRAADGVTRARDEDSLRASAIGDTMKRNWTGRLVPIGEASGDRRIFKAGGDYSFRTFPLPLMHQAQTSGGHDESVTIGSIRSAEVREDGIYAEGVIFDTPAAQEAAAMLEEGVTRPSIDWADEQWELVDSSGNPIDPEALTAETIDDVVYQITGMTLMAATLVAKPAFDGTYVTLEETEDGETVDTEEDETALAASLVAAGHPSAPVFDADAFADPRLDKITGIHATPDGRVVGHVATWNECHVGVRDRCVMAPRSKTGYALFHVSEVETSDGPVAVGRLTVGAGHADPRAGVVPAQEHYDNAASCWALGRVYEDEHGIAFAGVVHPDATPRQIMDGTSAPLSGDWRRHAGNLELVAALTVNTPGYPVVRGAADDRGRDYSLVAAGVVPLETHERERPLSEIVASAAKAAVAEYAEHARRVERAAAVAGRARERIEAETAERVAAIVSRREEVLA